MDPVPDTPQLEQAYALLKSEQQRLRSLQLRFALVLIVILLAFAGATLAMARNMYTAEHFAPAVQTQVQSLMPEVLAEARKVAEAAQPVYVAEAKRVGERVLPKVLDQAALEGSALVEQLQDRVEKELDATAERIHKRQIERLAKRIPTLAKPANFEHAVETLQAQIAEDTADVLLHIHESFATDVKGVKRELAKFRPNPYLDMDENARVLEYVHLWLTMLDRQVLLIDDEVSHGK